MLVVFFPKTVILIMWLPDYRHTSYVWDLLTQSQLGTKIP